MYLEDWHALFTLKGIAQGQFNERLIAYYKSLFGGDPTAAAALNYFLLNPSSISFDPASLFSSGQAGLWYEPSDISTLYQDSAGTTPVTAATQPIGKIVDKSGRANHAYQATSTSRPLYATSYASEVYDGVDDFVSTNTFAAGTLTNNMDCFIVLRRAVDTNAMFMCAATNFAACIDASGSSTTNLAGTPTYAVDGVDVPGGTSTTRLQLKTALPINTWHVLEIRNVDLSLWDLFLNKWNGGSGFNFNGSEGSVVLCPAQSTASRNSIRTYLGNQVGLTL